MNPLAVLSAVVGVAIFPGAAYAGLLAALVAVGGRIPTGLRPAQLDELMVAVGVSAACGLLAFPGSPLFGLPTGVSLVVFVTAVAAAIAWGSAERWPWQRLAAGAAAVAPLLGLASVAMTLDLRTIAAAGGPVGAARPWAVAAVLMALPALVRPFDPHTARLGRAALVAAIGLACFSLAGFAPLAGPPPRGGRPRRPRCARVRRSDRGGPSRPGGRRAGIGTARPGARRGLSRRRAPLSRRSGGNSGRISDSISAIETLGFGSTL